MGVDKSVLKNCSRCQEELHYMDLLEGMCLTCVVERMKELEADLRKAKCLTLYDQEGELVTQGALNALLCQNVSYKKYNLDLGRALDSLIRHALKCEEGLDRLHGLGSDSGSGCSVEICDAKKTLGRSFMGGPMW